MAAAARRARRCRIGVLVEKVELVVRIAEAGASERLAETLRTAFETASGVVDASRWGAAVPAGRVDPPPLA
jgi:hypothetical protein